MLLDETWATTNTGPRHIRAPHGERALDAVPHGHWKTTNFAGALRAEGFVAPLVLDGAINGASFLAYVGQFLAPALEPADTVVLDDLASRKVTDVREAIEAVGARLLYLPSYSPDLNRIEMAFRKLLGEFPPSECRRYLARCGHGQAA